MKKGQAPGQAKKITKKQLKQFNLTTGSNVPLDDESIKKFDSLDNDLVLDTKTTNMIAKNKELIAESKRLDAEIEKPAKSNNVYMDNKQVTGGTTVNNSKTFASNQRVESTDRATKELNNVYGYALA